MIVSNTRLYSGLYGPKFPPRPSTILSRRESTRSAYVKVSLQSGAHGPGSFGVPAVRDDTQGTVLIAGGRELRQMLCVDAGVAAEHLPLRWPLWSVRRPTTVPIRPMVASCLFSLTGFPPYG
ncbi:hypothetical protein [Nonomuraea sp. SYSU D8015]|uniref:hypothetical protein n=1 Tax=Nonomuraea sp. SYSU D8015 TaxID=2593644 RepID=UPI001660EF4C|nr:hypothetical protein [Nonomuraea sp. SYSU D8015]